jgi:twitching motility protein PilT
MAYIDQFFQVLVDTGASDLHLAEGQPPKIRRHGDIVAIREEVLSREEVTQMLSEICTPKRWQKFEETGDLDFAYEMNSDSRFRCNYLKQATGYGAVFRLIPTKIATLEQLKVPQVIKEFGRMRGGLVLVTGPTGSGKSTTLAALIDYINTNYSRHIVTIEEPIEFVHGNKRSIITQREVPEHAPSFPVGLKAALREDADIVLVGEMRDLETISLALTAAETGMLVFGTLHTNNARKTVDVVSLSARRDCAAFDETSGWFWSGGGERNSRGQQRCGGDHPRRCHAEAAGCDCRRPGGRHAVHG